MGADGRSGEAECESQRDDDAETTHLSSRRDGDVECRPQIEIVESLEVRVDLPDARARQGGHLDEEVVPVRAGEVLLGFRGTRRVPEGELNRAVPRQSELRPVRVVIQEDRERVYPDRRRVRIRFEMESQTDLDHVDDEDSI